MNSDHENLPDLLGRDGAADLDKSNDSSLSANENNGQDRPAVVPNESEGANDDDLQEEGNGNRLRPAIVLIESESDGEHGMGLAVVEDKRSQNKRLKQKANDIKKSFVSLLMPFQKPS